MDESGELIRVGGRLRRSEDLELTAIHPVILDPSHQATKLWIQDVDARLHHLGPERVFAELRHSFWFLRGREAISMDCFGPFEVKVGRRREKRWGIIFKCRTTRAVHLDLLNGIDTDAFLMALRRFVARRGTPAELFSDQGTNFKGGERKLREAFTEISPTLQEYLAPQKTAFHFNPPAAPQFGGSLLQVVYRGNELISRRRWKHSQILADHFWARFIRLYVSSLQVRQKWQASPADIVKDCMVMIADPQFPRALWPIGRVIKTHLSSDGHIQSADVKVRERVYTWPVARLVVLPALPSGDDEDKSLSTTLSQL